MKLKKNLLVGLSIFFALLLTRASAQADTPPDLDAWLNSHPDIANAILWEFPSNNPPSSPLQIFHLILYTLQPPFDPGIYEKIVSYLPAINSYINRQPPGARSRKFIQVKNRVSLETQLSPQFLKQLGLSWKLQSSLPSPPTPGPPPPPAQDQGAIAQNWSSFPEANKQKVRDAYTSLWTWIETCWPKYQDYLNTNVKPAEFDTCFSTAEPAGYPPTDLQWMDNPPSSTSTWAVISSDAAFDLYAKMVGLSLVLEIKGNIVSGTIAELDSNGKKQILDGTTWFRYVPIGDSHWGTINYEGYLVATTVIPAPATLTFSFLAQNKLVGTNKLDTVTKVFAWERDNMWHVMGGNLHDDCPYKEGGFYSGGYMGGMPLSRVINGTVMGCPLYYDNGQGGESSFYDPAVHHWTEGCGGTAGFNEQVFRVVNIPAEMTSYSHFQNNFVVDNNTRLWIAHADDTYGSLYSVWNGIAEIPIGDILIPDAIYKTWVVDYDPNDPNLTQAQKDAYAAKNDKAVTKQSIDLMIKYLPKGMLQWYCWYDQGVPHNQSYMYNEYYKDQYTMQELNTMYNPAWGTNVPGVWANMDSKVASLGGCNVQWP